MKTILIAFVMSLSATASVFAMDCQTAENAFFAQNEGQSFARNRQAFLADPDRWARAAKDYLSGAQMIGLNMNGSHSSPAKTAKEFLVNAAIVDCWRHTVTSAGPRTKAIASHFDAQVTPAMRTSLETYARSMK